MDYGEYGGIVYVDGSEMYGNCDQTIGNVIRDGDIGGLTSIAESGDSIYNTVCHSVIGDKDSGIIICLRGVEIYGIFLYIDGQLTECVECTEKDGVIEIKGDYLEPITIRILRDLISIECSFVDVAGRKWAGLSGYMMGNGFEAW